MIQDVLTFWSIKETFVCAAAVVTLVVGAISWAVWR